jgi:hypothetical protein
MQNSTTFTTIFLFYKYASREKVKSQRVSLGNTTCTKFKIEKI